MSEEPREIEDLLNLQKSYTIFNVHLEVYLEDEEKCVRIFEPGDGENKQNFIYTKFGYIDGSEELADFVIDEGTIIWEKILGKNYIPGIYEVDLLLKVMRDSDGYRHWFYFEYENHDNVLYQGSAEKYIQELIDWRNLTESETLMDIFL